MHRHRQSNLLLRALIAAQRAYDMNSKVISASDQMMATVTQMRS